MEGRLTEWRRLLRGSTTQGRTVLERIIAGRIVFNPTADGAGYASEAPTRYDKLFAGVAVRVPSFIRVGDTRGTEGLTNSDTMDEDYGRLLEQAYNRMSFLRQG